jgi:hypothetical protein
VTGRIHHPYTVWEDFQSGLYRAVPVDHYAETAAHILSDPDTFYAGARDMLAAWPRAAEQNLTNLEQNRRAWLGQATCCYLANCPEGATRLGWWLLFEVDRAAANAIADRVIAEWEAVRDGDLTLFEEHRSA